MKTERPRVSYFPAALLAFLLFMLAVPVWSSSATKETSGAVPAASAPVASQYAGSDVCKSCHEELYTKSFETTPHYKTTLKNGHGCESCHGPGAAHVEGGGDVTKIVRFKELTRQQASTRCLSCHGDSRGQAHFSRSAHASNDVGCLDCHSPHHAKEPQRLLTKAQPELCYSCHTATKADFAKPFHHRVDEGFVQCSDCHNLHGTGTLRNTRSVASGDAICAKCHADKQGPFVFEHLPVKTEGCTSCHMAHGGTNPRLLRVSQTSLLCLQCHTVPTQSPIGPAHNLSQKYQACTMCHTAVHGSNSSNVLFKRGTHDQSSSNSGFSLLSYCNQPCRSEGFHVVFCHSSRVFGCLDPVRSSGGLCPVGTVVRHTARGGRRRLRRSPVD